MFPVREASSRGHRVRPRQEAPEQELEWTATKGGGRDGTTGHLADAWARAGAKAVTAMTTVSMQIRCVTCDGRLADVLNVIDAGYVILEMTCPTCLRSRLEIVGWLDRVEAED